MESQEKNQNVNQDTNQVEIKDLIPLCIKNWYWFVISVIICLGAAITYLKVTPPKYTRTAEILIKNDRKGKSIASAAMGEFSDLGLVNPISNVNNEIHAIMSVSNLNEVVKRLHLNTRYTVDGRFHENLLYGTTLPLLITSPEGDMDMSRTFDLKITSDTTFSISNFTMRGEPVEAEKGMTGSFGDTLVTPVGPLVIAQSQFFDRAKCDDLIHVRIASVYRTAYSFRSAISTALADKNAEVIKMSIQDINIQRAEDILNTIIDVYNEKWVADKNQIAKSTSNFIAERLNMIERDLSNVDSDISSYKSANLITDVAQASNIYMTQSSNIEAKITELNNELYMAKYIRDYLGSEKLQILPANALMSNASLGNQINGYNSQLIDRNNLVAASSENNPLVKEMDSNLESLRKSIITSIDNEVISLQNQISSLNSSNSKAKLKLAANPTQTKYLLSVERQQSVKEALYIYLLQKREENELSQAFTAYNTQIIDSPYGSNNATSPSNSKIMLLGLLLGLCLPLAVIYASLLFNTTVRGRADVKQLTLPFLGEIPQIKTGKALTVKQFRKNIKKGERGEAVMAVKQGGRDVVNEAFRVLRTNIEFMSQDKSKNVSIVTSMNPGSGKSFVTINMAMSLAIKHKRVLVIDGDLRHASTSQFVKSPKEGFSNYLAGQRDTYKDLIVNYEDQPDLFVLPVGTIPPNPTELIAEPKFAQAIEELRPEYDYIFIDCPPIDMMADTQIIEKCADRTIFLIRVKMFERSMLADVQQAYETGRFKNMALVLNGTEAAGGYGNRYGYHYGYRYGYHYGYGYGAYGNDKSDN